jgi:flavin reductase (DIM6/NTAB) family NADH-FMN oxidoreductase RutF
VNLRTVFGAFPSGVAAVCALRNNKPVGMAVSTFTPVSLDPPLISLCIQQTSTTWPQLREASVLGVSILSVDHEDAARQLSLKTGDRFAGLETLTAPSGALHLKESCAWFHCTVHSELAAGDHLIVLLHIVESGHRDLGSPLVFHASRFRRLAEY